MSGLTNKYVENIGKEHCRDFIGTFPCNILPEIEGKESFSVIFNESRHDEEGTHFVAVLSELIITFAIMSISEVIPAISISESDVG